MSNLFIARPTASDAGILSAPIVETDYPITNLQTPQPREFTRTNSNSDWYVVEDLGSAIAVNVIALLYTNADISTQWRIRGATSEANLTAAPGYDSSVINHWPDADDSSWDRTHAVKLLTTPQTYQWWRIDISGLSGLDYYEAARLFIAAAFNPARSAAIGLELGILDFSLTAESQGSTFRRQKKQKRVLSMAFEVRDEAETYDEHYDLQRLIGAGGNVLVCHDVSARVMDRLIYAYIAQMAPILHGQYSPAYSGNIHEITYQFTEYEKP